MSEILDSNYTRERKAEIEYKQLVKIGVPEKIALLIVKHKYKIDDQDVINCILDIKDEQLEIQNELSNFVELSETLFSNENLISNLNLNDKN